MPAFAGGKSIVPAIPQADVADDYASPIVADVTGNGVPDIIATAASVELNAYDPNGNLINIATAPLDSQGKLEQYDIAPAVGNFDGLGGLCMATVTYDPYSASPTIPDQVQIYRLPTSNLAPPWPMLRRTNSGDAVMRSPTYDLSYITQTFNALQGSLPSEATAVVYLNALNNDSTNLLSTAQLIASSLSVLDNEVTKIYQAFLGQAPDSYALSYWSNYLATNTYRQMEELVAGSTAFAQRAGGSVSQEVTYVYQAILNRSPAQSEINAWVGSKLPMQTIATDIINSAESITDQFNTVIQAMFGKGSQSYIPADDKASYSLESTTPASVKRS